MQLYIRLPPVVSCSVQPCLTSMILSSELCSWLHSHGHVLCNGKAALQNSFQHSCPLMTVRPRWLHLSEVLDSSNRHICWHT